MYKVFNINQTKQLYSTSTKTNTYGYFKMFIEFPNYPQLSQRQKCNSPLFKQIRSESKYKLVPHKAFLSNSIVESLRKLLNTPGILQYYVTHGYH